VKRSGPIYAVLPTISVDAAQKSWVHFGVFPRRMTRPRSPCPSALTSLTHPDRRTVSRALAATTPIIYSRTRFLPHPHVMVSSCLPHPTATNATEQTKRCALTAFRTRLCVSQPSLDKGPPAGPVFSPFKHKIPRAPPARTPTERARYSAHRTRLPLGPLLYVFLLVSLSGKFFLFFGAIHRRVRWLAGSRLSRCLISSRSIRTPLNTLTHSLKSKQ
jgi:hypothetical protein